MSVFRLIVLLCGVCSQALVATRFEQATSGNDLTLTLYDDDDIPVGFISCEKIPMTSWHAIHSLYVYPQFRQKGYGTLLMKQVCRILQKRAATCAYIQPGPFELQDGEAVCVGDAYEDKIHMLVKLYKKLGFKPASSLTAKVAALYYYLAGIYEDSQHLMLKKF